MKIHTDEELLKALLDGKRVRTFNSDGSERMNSPFTLENGWIKDCKGSEAGVDFFDSFYSSIEEIPVERWVNLYEDGNTSIHKSKKRALYVAKKYPHRLKKTTKVEL